MSMSHRVAVMIVMTVAMIVVMCAMRGMLQVSRS